MSLNDRLNPNDGSLIDEIDSKILAAHEKVAELWQNRTYKEKEVLGRYLRGASSFSFLNTAILNPSLATKLLSSFLSLNQGAKFAFGVKTTNRLEEETKSEIMGLPKKFCKYSDVFIYGCSAVLLPISALSIGYDLHAGDTNGTLKNAADLSLWLGLAFYQAAGYIERSSLGKPPKKPKKKPILERIKEKLDELMPRPIPEPAYFNNTK